MTLLFGTRKMDFIFLAIVLNFMLYHQLSEVFPVADPRIQPCQVEQRSPLLNYCCGP